MWDGNLENSVLGKVIISTLLRADLRRYFRNMEE